MLKRKNGVIKIALTVFVLGICTIFGKNLSRLSWAYEVPIENIDVRDTKTGEWVWDGKYQKWWYKYSDGTFPASE
ncbi:MAG: hypothetical protein Q4D52_01730 [Eubacteriales bacterium]|nr:hypothetical protein [Eubacteriales bacterium]